MGEGQLDQRAPTEEVVPKKEKLKDPTNSHFFQKINIQRHPVVEEEQTLKLKDEIN